MCVCERRAQKFPVFFDVTSVAPVKNPSRVNFAAGSFIVTKASLRDSPQRYWSIVEQVIAKISKVTQCVVCHVRAFCLLLC